MNWLIKFKLIQVPNTEMNGMSNFLNFLLQSNNSPKLSAMEANFCNVLDRPWHIRVGPKIISTHRLFESYLDFN